MPRDNRCMYVAHVCCVAVIDKNSHHVHSLCNIIIITLFHPKDHMSICHSYLQSKKELHVYNIDICNINFGSK